MDVISALILFGWGLKETHIKWDRIKTSGSRKHLASQLVNRPTEKVILRSRISRLSSAEKNYLRKEGKARRRGKPAQLERKEKACEPRSGIHK